MVGKSWKHYNLELDHYTPSLQKWKPHQRKQRKPRWRRRNNKKKNCRGSRKNSQKVKLNRDQKSEARKSRFFPRIGLPKLALNCPSRSKLLPRSLRKGNELVCFLDFCRFRYNFKRFVLKPGISCLQKRWEFLTCRYAELWNIFLMALLWYTAAVVRVTCTWCVRYKIQKLQTRFSWKQEYWIYVVLQESRGFFTFHLSL